MRFAIPVLLAVCTAPLLTSQDVTFKEDVRLVEIYATVYDHGGRPVQGLTRDAFEVRDCGVVQPIRAFEASDKALSCALLLDSTGSMRDVMPAVRNAAREFIDALRPNDSVGVYAFNDHLEELAGIGANHAAARHALIRLHAEGRTALFDSISQLAHTMENRPGKKIIVVLTDGGDNASVLNTQAAAERARKAGIPIFAIAEGDALKDRAAEKLLHKLAEATGGHAYKARQNKDIDAIFANIAGDLRNGYLLAFKPPAEEKQTSWHELQVAVKANEQRLKIRARTGYMLE
jgi:Ca-activated chloride channel family protein